MSSRTVLERSDVRWKKASPEGFESVHRPFETVSRVLSRGWTEQDGVRPMAVDTIWDKDQPIKLRDGTVIYCDVFRPASSEDTPVPALIAWGPFGKSSDGFLSLNRMKYRAGIPKDWTSGLENWEAPDPAEWCGRGYAVINICARGSYNSEGKQVVYGTQEGRDGYDAIEWVAQQTWCTSKTCMVGNSWLSSTQWFIAAEKPPHLTAIAPWEGLGDYYRESICRGGIPEFTFWELLLSKFVAGTGEREDVAAMTDERPFIDDYWLDKKPKLQNIDIPMYALMSYSSLLHTEGSFRGFFMSKSKEKWLRVHDTHEWHDIYQPKNNDELQSFCDHYLKDVENDWVNTPRMRLSLLGYNMPNIVNRPIASYPPPDFKYGIFHLDASTMQMTEQQPKGDAKVSYDAEERNDARLDKLTGVGFTHTFNTYTELCGWSKVSLFASADSAEDMDIFVILRKLDKDGKPLISYNIPWKDLPEGTTDADIPLENVYRYIGPNGRLRASHRATGQEPDLTAEQRGFLSEAYVWHPHDGQQKLAKGEIVKLDIHLWPGGMIFSAGESMRLEIKGVHPAMPEFEPLLPLLPNHNVGKHNIHTGPSYPCTYLVALSSRLPEQ